MYQQNCKVNTNIPNANAECSQQQRVQKFRLLAAFDFDYTVTAQNTDTVVRDMLHPHKITGQLNAIVDELGWTEYMAAVFRLLHEQNCKPEQIVDTVRCIPEVPGFVRLIKTLYQQYNCDLIIISDSNSVFIDEWLQAHGLAKYFVGVFTNPAHFCEDGLLDIQPYHRKKDHNCRLSAVNLCKGKILDHFLIEQNLRKNCQYDRVIYVGDGNNDICPVLRLRAGDIACARENFALEKSLSRNKNTLKVKAKLLIWKNGFDLFEQLDKILEPKKETNQKIKNL